MAINIDTVYQKVLAIANKEQRGYITPQEFNLFANQAQLSIFQEYFYSLNQANRLPGADLEYSDKADILQEKISLFKYTTNLEYDVGSDNHYSTFTIPEEVFKLGTVYYSPLGEQLVDDPYATKGSGVELVSNGTFSGTTNWTAASQITTDTSGTGVLISNNSNSSVYPQFQSDTITLVPGKTYKLKWEVVSVDRGANSVSPGLSGNPKVFVRAVGSGGGHYRPLYHNGGLHNIILEEGKHQRFFTWDLPAHNNDPNNYYYTENNGNTSARISFELASAHVANMSARINNVSLQEVGTDWTFVNNYLTNGWSVGRQWGNNQISYWNLSHSPGENNSYLTTSMELETGETYAISFKISNATAGKLRLANHLFETTEEDQTWDGSNDSLTIWEPENGNGKFTRYWKQGEARTTQLGLWASKSFDGQINRITVRKISDLGDSKEVDFLQERELKEVLNSKLLKPTLKDPVYTRRNNGITIYPTTINSGVRCNYIKKPSQANWAYTEINGTAMYNASNSVNFELHESEEETLVTRILGAAGVVLKDPLLIQQAQRTDAMNEAMKKQ